MQDCARRLSMIESFKYAEQGKSPHGIYDIKNHNQFYMELDADRAGYERTLKFLKNICPKAYDVAINEKNGWACLKKLEIVRTKLDEYHKETWSHGTNPNNGPVSTMHKTSMIIDEILPLLHEEDKKYIFKTFAPSFFF